MVTLEKIAQLAQACNFDSIGPLVNVDRNKLDALGAATKYDVCILSWRLELPGVCHSFTHDGRCISMFKTLLTNQCSHQCSYCINATTCSNRPKIFSYTSDELAKLMLSLHRSNYIEGLFLSSGSGRDQDIIMEKIIETARLLRLKHGFNGYIHLKILPGSSFACRRSHGTGR
jgi:predicted DNA-binding helix-hairpin-helix protein